MAQKNVRKDGIYLDDSEMDDFLTLCDKRSVYEAEQRAIAAERERNIAMAYAYQSQLAAENARHAQLAAERTRPHNIITFGSTTTGNRNTFGNPNQLLEVHGTQMIQQQNLINQQKMNGTYNPLRKKGPF
ncbi:MAG: hypothetical protein WC713_11350 [Candidatus Methylomirabilota bacterium]|jgi:hypothetical protein